MFLLRGFMPERFRYAHRDLRQADEPPPPPELPLDQALAQLLPVAPPEPHKLMAPDDLEVAIQCADILDGTLPHWHRGRGDAEPPEAAPLGPEFERQLENAKREANGEPPLGDDATWNGDYWTDGEEGDDDDPSLA
jgi:hypothetical protein